MPRETLFFRWMIIAALADWLITRSLARMAIFMPKSPPVLAIYQGLVSVGQYASVLCALLAIFGIGWLAWRARAEAKGLPSLGMVVLCGLNLSALLVSANEWSRLAAQIILLGLGLWFAARILSANQGLLWRVALLTPVAAIWLGSLYHTLQSLYAAMEWVGPPVAAMTLFNLGELLVVLSPLGLWWLIGRGVPFKRAPMLYTLGSLPTLLYLVASWLNPSMTGILAVWSSGLTLYLPAPLYALSLWVACITILVSSKTSPSAGWALLLLAAAGYAPQLSSQIYLGILAMSILADFWSELTQPSGLPELQRPANLRERVRLLL